MEVAMLERAVVVDRTLADSFPASDPPAWTGGGARIRPPLEVEPPRPPRRGVSAGAALAAFAGVIAVALLVPVFVVVLPFVLLVRAVMALVVWVVAPGKPTAGNG
jgi:hypothetical protein